MSILIFCVDFSNIMIIRCHFHSLNGRHKWPQLYGSLSLLALYGSLTITAELKPFSHDAHFQTKSLRIWICKCCSLCNITNGMKQEWKSFSVRDLEIFWCKNYESMNFKICELIETMSLFKIMNLLTFVELIKIVN